MSGRAGGAGPSLEPYPLLLQPRLHRRLWGGTRLPGWLGRPAGALPLAGPEGEPVGECWLVGEENVVTNGPYAGATLGDLARRAGAALVGESAAARYGARVPLLAKLLDAAHDLSVQVHPDDSYASREEAASGHLGKAEAWYFLECEPGAAVLRGFERAMTPDAVRLAVQEGTLAGSMRRVPVGPGDVVVNPAGTVHALGAGCFLYEIQQSSDLTYRLFDFGRLGADGRPRELHLGKALDVADLSGAPYGAPAPRALGGGWTRLVDLPQLTLDRLEVTPGRLVRGSTSARSLAVMFVAGGEMTLESRAGALGLRRGEAVVLPAALGDHALSGAGEVLRSTVGEPSR